MKFRLFHIHYLIAITLFVSGLLTKDFLIAKATPTAGSEYGFQSFFIPIAAYLLVNGLCYHYWHHKNKPVQAGAILIQLIFTIVGLFFSFQLYVSLSIFGATHYAMGDFVNRATLQAYSLDLNLPTPVLVTGSLFMLASLIYFMISLSTATQIYDKGHD